MCGIAGVRKFGKTPITGEELILLLCAIEHRGLHATGIALVNPNGIQVMKAPLPAWKFTREPAFKEFLKVNLTENTEIALLHTRWATGGNPEINENNHPMWDGETAVTHNGMINNSGHLFTQGKYTKTCDTDSDIVRAIVSEHGFEEKGLRELAKMIGSAAIACVSTKYPGKLLLARSGSPLTYGFTEGGEKLYWASEAQAIIKAAKPYHKVRNVWVQDTKTNVSVGSMPDNTAWLFGPQELEMHGEFPVCAYYRQPDYSKGRENYHTKRKAWKREARFQSGGTTSTPAAGTQRVIQHIVPPASATGKVEVRSNNVAVQANTEPIKGSVIKCPGCGLGVINTMGRVWRDLQCPTCKSSLA